MAYTGDEFQPGFTATVVIASDGTKYDSITEHRFSKILDMTNTQYRHNEISIESNRKRGKYKPDYTIERVIDGMPYLDIIDVKGKALACDPDGREAVRAFVGELGKMQKGYFSIYRYFALVYDREIIYYDADTELKPLTYKEHGIQKTENLLGEPGERYYCSSCGHFDIRRKGEDECIYCGSKMDKFGGYSFSGYVEEKSNPHKLPHRTDWEKDEQKRIEALARKANIALVDEEDQFHIEFPDTISLAALWKPDFAYEPFADKLHVMGTARKQQAVISCIQDSKPYHFMVKYLCNLAAKESMIEQAIFATPKGLFLAERHISKLRPASFKTCHHCHKGYISEISDEECPYCGKNGATTIE